MFGNEDFMMDEELRIMSKEIIDELYNWRGMTMEEIGEIFGVTNTAIYRRMVRYGIERRNNSEAQKPKKVLREELERLYHDEGMTLMQIGEIFGLSVSAIYKRMVGYGIERRIGCDKVNREGSRRGGINAYLVGKGIHKFTSEEKSKFGKIGGKNSARSRSIPWFEPGVTCVYVGPSEEECAFILSRKEKYQYKYGPNKGSPIWGLIAERLNIVYHKGEIVRTADKVKSTINNTKYRLNGRKKSL